MATSNNTIKTRIQLKSDTEVNWNKAGPKDGSPGFIPLRGELIIYSADERHAFSRLKVGDGETNVVNLPFIDAGTINGKEVEIVQAAAFSNFPQPGSSDKLYIDMSRNRIYRYTPASGYSLLSNFDFNITRTTVSNIVGWSPGALTQASIDNQTLKVNNGVLPSLVYDARSVVTNITKEEN